MDRLHLSLRTQESLRRLLTEKHVLACIDYLNKGITDAAMCAMGLSLGGVKHGF